jgi:hypothetical protein
MNLWCGAEPGLELNTRPNKAVERRETSWRLFPAAHRERSATYGKKTKLNQHFAV